MDTVVISHAYYWQCPKCKWDNYGKFIPVTDKELLEEARRQMGHDDAGEDWKPKPEATGEVGFQMAPVDTVCGYCGIMFKISDGVTGDGD